MSTAPSPAPAAPLPEHQQFKLPEITIAAPLCFPTPLRADVPGFQDLMLFPGDAEVFLLPQPPATGRCFALRFKTSNGIHFFWIQDPKDEEDEAKMKNMNKELGNEPAPDSSAGDVPTGDGECLALPSYRLSQKSL